MAKRPAPVPPTYAELVRTIRGVVTLFEEIGSSISIPGRLRFRVIRCLDRLRDVLNRVENGGK